MTNQLLTNWNDMLGQAEVSKVCFGCILVLDNIFVVCIDVKFKNLKRIDHFSNYTISAYPGLQILRCIS